MERVETLCNRLKDQIQQQASVDELMLTVQMLQAELMHLKTAAEEQPVSGSVAIDIPVNFELPEVQEPSAPAEEKIVEILQIDESEVEAELEEIRRNAEARNKISVQNKPPMFFDPVEDTPTLFNQEGAHQATPARELHEVIAGDEGASLNEALKTARTELSETLQESPIKDLKKAIGINDRFLFINELFRGDEVMYERSIKTINSFAIYPEAEYWIKRELKLKLGWSDTSSTVKQFDQLVKRRFSVM